MKRRYRTVDYYDGKEVIYQGYSLERAKAAGRKRELNTNGECCCVVEIASLAWTVVTDDMDE